MTTMPAGVLTDQGVAGVHDDPDSPPPADANTAPHGWVWNRASGSWRPAKRAPKPGTRRESILNAAAASSGSGDRSEPAAGPVNAAPHSPTDQDPAPGWQGDGQAAGEAPLGGDSVGSLPRTASGKLRFDDVPQQVKDDIAGLAGLVATPILSLLQSLDPYCGTALAQNLEPVVDAALPLICRSERIVRYFAEDQADWLLWGKLAMALKPVAQAIAEHHIFRTVRVVRDEQTGAVSFERRAAGEDWSGPGDHLTPHAQPAYAA